MTAFDVVLYIKKNASLSNGVRERARVSQPLRITNATSREEAIGIATALVTPNYAVLRVVDCTEVSP